jgi:ABC-type sugar transport system ATPase subunit
VVAGIALVPEDRAHNAVVPNLTVTENITLSRIGSFTVGGPVPWLRRGREAKVARDLYRRLDIRPAGSENRKISTLSGGNQQKAIIARWLTEECSVYLFDEPTEGIDVGAREDVYRVIRELAAAGAGVIVSTSEIEEVVELADEVLIMRNGTIAASLTGDNITEHAVSHACLDFSKEEAA